MTENEAREAICEVGHNLWQLGFVAANDGNISVKLDENVFLATPTGTSKRILRPEMLIMVNEKNEVIKEAPG